MRLVHQKSQDVALDQHLVILVAGKYHKSYLHKVLAHFTPLLLSSFSKTYLASQATHHLHLISATWVVRESGDVERRGN